MLHLYAVSLVLALFCCACSNNSVEPQADDEFREVKFFSRGDDIISPAPLGTSDSILGMAYDARLNDKDSNGVRHRMYPFVVTNSTEKQYNSSFTLLESSTELNASADVLFAKGQVTRKKNMRYAVLRVQYINRVLALQTQGAPLYPGKLFASKIYYGWSVYYVFEGDATQLNARVATNLFSIINANGDLAREVKRLQIRTYTVTRGLVPKVKDAVVIASTEEDIKRNFTTSGSDNQPIAIEYECAASFSVPAVNVEAPKYRPGNFVLDNIGFSIAETQADGSSWDIGSRPDPIISIYLNQKHIYTAQFEDVLADTVEIGTPVTIGQGDQVYVVLSDEDFDDNDPIGTFGVMGSTIFSDYYIHDPVPLEPASNEVQTKNVTLFITPAR